MNFRTIRCLAFAIATVIFGLDCFHQSGAFSQDDSVAAEKAKASIDSSPSAPIDTTDSSTAPPRALWVWSTQQILKNSSRRTELLEFCQKQRIGTIWLQLLYDVRQLPLDQTKSICTIREQHEFRRLLREAHGAGIQVHALDGYPEFSLIDYHCVPVAIMEALLDFNEVGEKDERFDGAHFDNEPYALVGWQSEELRPRIITEFLILNQKCKAVADRQKNFEFGIDIPVWWHQTGDDADPTLARFAFDGQTRTLAEHCMSTVDNIGIMNYRDKANGVDGMIANGQSILESVPQHGPRVLMGVETVAPAESQVWFAVGLPRSEFEYVAQEEDNQMVWRSRFNGVRLRTFDDGKNVHVGIEIPEDRLRKSAGFHETLRVLVDTFGVGNRVDSEVAEYAGQGLEAIKRNGEFKSPAIRELEINGLPEKQPGIHATSIMMSKITFGDNDLTRFNSELSEAEEAFSRMTGFGGMAIHSFESARELK